jgi:hypothetical protein
MKKIFFRLMLFAWRFLRFRDAGMWQRRVLALP